jgi:hypothetical protein
MEASLFQEGYIKKGELWGEGELAISNLLQKLIKNHDRE